MDINAITTPPVGSKRPFAALDLPIEAPQDATIDLNAAPEPTLEPLTKRPKITAITTDDPINIEDTRPEYSTIEQIVTRLKAALASKDSNIYDLIYVDALEEIAKLSDLHYNSDNQCIYIQNAYKDGKRKLCSRIADSGNKLRLCKICYGNRKQRRFKIILQWKLMISQQKISRKVEDAELESLLKYSHIVPIEAKARIDIKVNEIYKKMDDKIIEVAKLTSESGEKLKEFL